MSTADQEPEFLAKVIPDSRQRVKRIAVRTIHRGDLHKSPDVPKEDINDARTALSPDELRRVHEEHDATDGHQLGQAPGRRQHKTPEARNPWKKRRPPRK